MSDLASMKGHLAVLVIVLLLALLGDICSLLGDTIPLRVFKQFRIHHIKFFWSLTHTLQYSDSCEWCHKQRKGEVHQVTIRQRPSGSGLLVRLSKHCACLLHEPSLSKQQVAQCHLQAHLAVATTLALVKTQLDQKESKISLRKLYRSYVSRITSWWGCSLLGSAFHMKRASFLHQALLEHTSSYIAKHLELQGRVLSPQPCICTTLTLRIT